MSVNINPGLNDIGERRHNWVGEQLSLNGHNHSKTLNSADGVKDVWTLTVDTATNDHVYTFKIAGISVSFTADGSASVLEIVNGLYAAAVSDPAIGGQARISKTAVAVIVTGKRAGTPVLVTNAEAKMTLVHTASAADPGTIEFGRAIITDGVILNLTNNLNGGLVGGFAAQVDTLAYVYAGTEIIRLSIDYNGDTYLFEEAEASDAATTSAALAVKINAAMPANSVLAAASGDDLVLTAEVAGDSFKSFATISDGGGSISTTRGLATSFVDAFAGISCRVPSQAAQDAVILGAVDMGSDVLVLDLGGIAVDWNETVAYEGIVYVELAAGDNLGKFFASNSATRVLLPSARFYRDREDTGIAQLVLK